MASTMIIVLTVVYLMSMPIPNVAESSAEAYWKLNLGSETVMPKIVKDALIGANENANYVLQHEVQKGFKISKELESSILKDAEIVEYEMAFKVTNQQKESIKKLDQESIMLQTTHENPTIDPTKHSVYFTEPDLTRPGKTLKLNFMKIEDDAKFLPIQVTKSIPFSSKAFPRILDLFSVQANSSSADIMEDTIRACEIKAMSEEKKLCALTLEDMVDYVKSHVGKKVCTLSGYVAKDVQNVHKIVNSKKVESDVSMVCHKMGYPYAVFYCHNLKETSLYEISMVDSEGKKMDAIGVCHKDTSSWSPKHVSFQMLKVKPGSVPVCHFLNERSIAYVLK
ncbi:BURP domain protein RD22-like [Silene latifolia]|uniref:BURP domain protein RD22-like n=1 Tax=Silene latifolia TaxID=37657 RepID=UPI003D7723BF